MPEQVRQSIFFRTLYYNIIQQLCFSASDRIRIKFCKKKADIAKRQRLNTCCTTNMFRGDFERNTHTFIDGDSFNDDGGDKLGQCEGTKLMEGSQVYVAGTHKIYILLRMYTCNSITAVENEGIDKGCFDQFSFYGTSDTSVSDIQFAQCSFTRLEHDSSMVRLDYSGYWHNWRTKSVPCRFPKGLTVKTIAIKLEENVLTISFQWGSPVTVYPISHLQDELNRGRTNSIKIVMRNNDGDTCKTANLTGGIRRKILTKYLLVYLLLFLALLGQTLNSGNFAEYSNNLGDCVNLTVTGTVDVWILNTNPNLGESIAITHVYLDVSDKTGNFS